METLDSREIEDAVAQLTRVGRTAVERGLVVASGGDLSARIGDRAFVVTNAGTWLDQLTPESFTVLDLEGNVLQSGSRPSSEWRLHQMTYQTRPDSRAIIHLHPQYVLLLNALGHRIRLLTQDHVYYVRSVGETPFYPNGSDELAATAAKEAETHNCVVLSHHGCSVIGDSVSMAFRRALNLEEAAATTYRALLLGDRDTEFPQESMHAIEHILPSSR